MLNEIVIFIVERVFMLPISTPAPQCDLGTEFWILSPVLSPASSALHPQSPPNGSALARRLSGGLSMASAWRLLILFFGSADKSARSAVLILSELLPRPRLFLSSSSSSPSLNLDSAAKLRPPRIPDPLDYDPDIAIDDRQIGDHEGGE